MAEPPARSTSMPAADASECGDVTMPFGASVAGGPVRISNSNPRSVVRRRLRSGTDPPDHVIVVGGLADLVPLILLVPERDHRIVQGFDLGIFRRYVGKQLIRRLERRVEDVG